LRQRVVANFDAGNWEEVGLLTGQSTTIDRYPRLLRSLNWGDEDYSGNVLGVLRRIAEKNQKAFRVFEQYVDEHFPGEAEFVSAKPAERRITFAPNVFSVPDVSMETDLAAVMMPLRAEFTSIYKTISRACTSTGMRCLRADDIWEESAIVQDIFNLVFRAQVVIVDFTGKNPNVMYETGIAHTLGKHVIPISQSLDDVPFDLKHHRVLKYLANGQGLKQLETKIADRLRQMAPQPPDDGDIPYPFDDDIPVPDDDDTSLYAVSRGLPFPSALLRAGRDFLAVDYYEASFSCVTAKHQARAHPESSTPPVLVLVDLRRLDAVFLQASLEHRPIEAVVPGPEGILITRRPQTDFMNPDGACPA
jgi:AbiJ N-terminal domain 5